MKEKLINSLNEATEYEDFVYVMQDTSSYYIGTKITYAQAMENENIPFKFKAIIEHYLSKDTDVSTSIESHLYYMTEEQFSYKTFTQLKARVKISILEPKKKLFKKTDEYEYREKIVSLSDLVEMNLAKKKGNGLIIRELVISKLALMSFSV